MSTNMPLSQAFLLMRTNRLIHSTDHYSPPLQTPMLACLVFSPWSPRVSLPNRGACRSACVLSHCVSPAQGAGSSLEMVWVPRMAGTGRCRHRNRVRSGERAFGAVYEGQSPMKCSDCPSHLVNHSLPRKQHEHHHELTKDRSKITDRHHLQWDQSKWCLRADWLEKLLLWDCKLWKLIYQRLKSSPYWGGQLTDHSLQVRPLPGPPHFHSWTPVVSGAWLVKAPNFPLVLDLISHWSLTRCPSHPRTRVCGFVP